MDKGEEMMPTKAQLQERYDEAVKMYAELSDKYSLLADDFEQLQIRVHGLIEEKQKLNIETTNACHYRSVAENKADNVSKRLRKLEVYITDLFLDGELSP
jgi:chromosome segregation ATPase